MNGTKEVKLPVYSSVCPNDVGQTTLKRHFSSPLKRSEPGKG